MRNVTIFTLWYPLYYFCYPLTQFADTSFIAVDPHLSGIVQPCKNDFTSKYPISCAYKTFNYLVFFSFSLLKWSYCNCSLTSEVQKIGASLLIFMTIPSFTTDKHMSVKHLHELFQPSKMKTTQVFIGKIIIAILIWINYILLTICIRHSVCVWPYCVNDRNHMKRMTKKDLFKLLVYNMLII